ncbi:TetR/AcrR family transcriptional regulator [Serinibacter salmoneus]|uniref:TetR family transcriptional regulator n=1 Tax=Serinibacter salmoneus TaxID=556530 RepID=A0A2A9D2C0_9MICO|nr:TetR/AcrR family transcriptional regulator [Serinibacter salmoneus]PFG20092.1 TetR family transcriptional regulator [Serinibacter salmoneus]
MGRGRRPAGEVRADVIHAVGHILLAEGLAGLTYERVARESGVSKATLYKAWASLGVLALDGYVHAVEDTLAFPDTGDIRADLAHQLHRFVTLMTTTPAGRLLPELIGRSQADPELSAAYRELYSSVRRRLATDRMAAAQRAGQIRDDVDVRVLVDQLWGAVYHRLLVPDEVVDHAFAEALLANVLDGVLVGESTR